MIEPTYPSFQVSADNAIKLFKFGHVDIMDGEKVLCRLVLEK